MSRSKFKVGDYVLVAKRGWVGKIVEMREGDGKTACFVRPFDQIHGSYHWWDWDLDPLNPLEVIAIKLSR